MDRITSSISIIAPFFTLFEGYRSNKLYEITPTKRLLWELEKTNFKSFKFHKIKSYACRFTRVFSILVIFENYFLGLPQAIVFSVISESLSTLFASLTYVYHDLMTLIK